jgi:hypothetical protein
MYRKPPLSLAVSDWSVIQTSYAWAAEGSAEVRLIPAMAATDNVRNSPKRDRLWIVVTVFIGDLLPLKVRILAGY